MVKAVVIILFITKELYSFLLIALSKKAVKLPLPEEVRDVYDEDRYRLFKSYKKENIKLETISSIVSLIVNLILLAADVYATVFALFDGLNIYLSYFLFILIVTAISEVIGIPFSYYDTFVIEEKYGMNKTTKKTFVLDKVKSYIILTLLFTLIVSALIFFFSQYGILAIIWTCIFFISFSLLISALSLPLMKLFNKFTPLEDGELKTKLLTLCTKYNVEVKRIVVRDASRRTTTSNAFCSGLRKKTISIDDNLVENFSTDEIVAVFAHEFAHAKYKHILKSLPFSFLTTLILIATLGLMLECPALYMAFGFDGVNYLFAVLIVSYLIWPLSILLGTISNTISRKHEYEADAFAATEGYGEALISALKRLMNESLSEINPHPWIIVTEYSHPTLSQRIRQIRRHEASIE